MEPSTMDTDWIEAVMRINSAIVAAEDRLAVQVSELLTMAMEGRDMAEAEARLLSYARSLVLMRATQAQLLQEPGCGGVNAVDDQMDAYGQHPLFVLVSNLDRDFARVASRQPILPHRDDGLDRLLLRFIKARKLTSVFVLDEGLAFANVEVEAGHWAASFECKRAMLASLGILDKGYSEKFV
jgi:hypothetical protein